MYISAFLSIYLSIFFSFSSYNLFIYLSHLRVELEHNIVVVYVPVDKGEEVAQPGAAHRARDVGRVLEGDHQPLDSVLEQNIDICWLLQILDVYLDV